MREEAKVLLHDGVDPIMHTREVEAQRQAEFGNPFAQIAAELPEKNRRGGLAEVPLSKNAWLIGIARRDLGYKLITRIKPIDVLMPREAPQISSNTNGNICSLVTPQCLNAFNALGYAST